MPGDEFDFPTMARALILGDRETVARKTQEGLALWRLGRCQTAVPYLQRAERLEPSRPEPRHVLRRAERC